MIKIAQNRAATQSLKWVKYKDTDILPMWVADSEFEVAEPIKEALKKRVEHGVFGYHNPYHNKAALNAIERWLKKQYDWQIDQQWIVWTPGVVPAFNVMCQAFCQHGDGILVQEPNYPPLLNAPKNNGFETEKVETTLVNGRWTIDFDMLEEKAAKPSTKLFLLCNPMNPCGSVYSEQELARIEDICLRHDVQLCSDEIHADLILDDNYHHLPAGKLPKIGHKTVTLMAASKTFNIAGFGVSFAIIPDPEIRRRFKNACQGAVPSATNLGVLATQVAFTECDDWYQAQIAYLKENQRRFEQALADIPELKYVASAATYLAWVDCSGLSKDSLQEKSLQSYFESLGVGPSDGKDFGWPSFSRFNFACSTEMLEQAILRLRQVKAD